MRSWQSQENGGFGEHRARCKEIARGSDIQGESYAAWKQVRGSFHFRYILLKSTLNMTPIST